MLYSIGIYSWGKKTCIKISQSCQRIPLNLARKRKETTRKKDNTRQINTRDETPHNPQSFRPNTFRPLKYDNQVNIQHQFNNYQGHVQERHQDQQQWPRLSFGCGKSGHYRNECRSYQRT